MYSYVQGIVKEKHPTCVVIEVGGIGYEVAIPLSTYSRIPNVNEEVKLFTYLHVREDGWQLFGFSSLEEKELFKLLISISGIGPKLGLTVLSGIGIDKFNRAVKENDLISLTAISGIGKKTAERIIIELKEKVALSPVTAGRQETLAAAGLASELAEDCLRALMSLGYRRQEAQAAIKKVFDKKEVDQLSVEELIRHSLTYI